MDKDYKKLYEEALERARDLHDNHPLGQPQTWSICEKIFPILKESEDERIRKGLIKGLSAMRDIHKHQTFSDDAINIDDAIAWLEKQEEQKPTDEVKPKFNVGDWVQIDGGHVMKILDVKKEVLCYKILNWCGNESVRKISDIDSIAHLWTIEDAKDGDVLATKKGNPFIYDKYRYNNGLAYYYAGLDVNKELTLKSPYTMLTHFGKLCSVSPATKEQCNILFQKMKETGYEWDSKKKELKKIEQKSSWSEEDEKFLNYAISLTDDAQIKNFLKSIKERVQPQPKQEWSEEEGKNLSQIILLLDQLNHIEGFKGIKISNDIPSLINWLKSLKPNHWKPTEEQMEALKCSYKSYIIDGKERRTLESLYNDLKSL